MMEAGLFAAIVFGLVYVLLMVVERWIHKLTKNKDSNYRWGVWTFAVLAAAYTFVANLGR
jgi:hypothetical protein